MAITKALSQGGFKNSTDYTAKHDIRHDFFNPEFDIFWGGGIRQKTQAV